MLIFYQFECISAPSFILVTRTGSSRREGTSRSISEEMLGTSPRSFCKKGLFLLFNFGMRSVRYRNSMRRNSWPVRDEILNNKLLPLLPNSILQSAWGSKRELIKSNTQRNKNEKKGRKDSSSRAKRRKWRNGKKCCEYCIPIPKRYGSL